MPKPEQTNQETIPGCTSAGLEIIKEIQDDGAVVFKHPTGGKVETYETDLYSFSYTWFSQLQALVDMLGDDEYVRFGSIFEVLICQAKSELDEVHSFIDREIGLVKVDRVRRNQWPHRTNRVVQVTLEPPEEGGESA